MRIIWWLTIIKWAKWWLTFIEYILYQPQPLKILQTFDKG